jgi:CHAT domain-containing protein
MRNLRQDASTEIDGLTRACLTAGARNVVASLWPLDDDAAAIFASAFYDTYLTDGDAPRALAATQARCAEGELGEFMQDAVNWAGYLVVGAPPEEALRRGS